MSQKYVFGYWIVLAHYNFNLWYCMVKISMKKKIFSKPSYDVTVTLDYTYRTLLHMRCILQT